MYPLEITLYLKGGKCTILYEMGKDPRTYIVRWDGESLNYII